jgi:tRNA(fMet)-specific endonuclease VapC
LALSDEAAKHNADIREHLTKQGNLLGANNLLIASTTKANALSLVTHKTAEFHLMPNL